MQARKPFRESVHEARIPITYEIVSLSGWQVEPYLDRLREVGLEERISAVNITNNPTARVYVDANTYGYRVLRDTTYKDVILHATCRDYTIASIQSWLLGAMANGITNITVMTGDHPKTGDYPRMGRVDDFNPLELITGITQYLNKGALFPELLAKPHRTTDRYRPHTHRLEEPTDFFVGAVLLPVRPGEVEYAQLKRKAGAQYFQGQITYDASLILDFFDEAIAAGVTFDVPILIGNTPITGKGLLKFLSTGLPNCRILPPTVKRLKEARDMGKESVQVGLEMFSAVRDGLRERGVHTKIGAHILPITSYPLSVEIVDGIVSLWSN